MNEVLKLCEKLYLHADDVRSNNKIKTRNEKSVVAVTY